MQLRDLASLTPLFGLRKLEFLTLSSTGLSQLPNYRTWLIHNIPSLRWLDYAKVKESERQSARSLYVNAEGSPTELAQSMGAQSVHIEAAATAQANGKTFEVPGTEQQKKGKGLTEEQKQRVRKAIEKAGTLEEIQRLKRMLQDGFIPDDKTAKA
jgi:U2 small nuclear ribonucleoprotein A'